ncbi:hypothetical protein [Actinotalea sp.]|uniref:hypothetical protein n=1 Tax=Actinotalea sp. TaxID=1872145 RepID=UPI0035642447
MTERPGPPTTEARLAAVRHAVTAVERAEGELQRAVDEARAAADPEEEILAALAVRDAAVRSGVVELLDALGPASVAALAGARTKEHAVDWATPRGSLPGPDAARRLRAAHQAWGRIARVQGEEAARAWILRPNPELGGDSPLVAIKRDRVRDLTPAVDALLCG